MRSEKINIVSFSYIKKYSKDMCCANIEERNWKESNFQEKEALKDS